MVLEEVFNIPQGTFRIFRQDSNQIFSDGDFTDRKNAIDITIVRQEKEFLKKFSISTFYVLDSKLNFLYGVGFHR
ncbi:MAG: hypothetical protein Q7S33_00485 [Nanoarchaeota archaeon]|nr:hypothetical protein [Nanoarchaeota archaeon]